MTEANDKITPVTMEWEEVDKGVNRVKEFTGGLTKREYFAAKAMQGMCAQFGHGKENDYAERAVKYADALIAELNK